MRRPEIVEAADPRDVGYVLVLLLFAQSVIGGAFFPSYHPIG